MWSDTDSCLKCSICVAACPVYRADPEFLGPKALGPDWYRLFQQGDTRPFAHVDDCTFCQLCEAACPAGVPVAHLIALQKSLVKRPFRMRVRDSVLTRPHWVARVPGALGLAPPALGRALGLSASAWRVRRRRRPRFDPLAAAVSARGTVGLFVDCFSRGYDREAVGAARALLEVWGFGVREVPGQSLCCGAAAYASGRPAQAGSMAKQMAAGLARDAQHLQWLVTLNATCDGTLRDEWPRFLDAVPVVPVRAFDDVAAEEAPEAFWRRLRAGAPHPPVALHTTCRGKVARGEGGLSRLAALAGIAAEPLDAACCGAAGSYAFKREHAAIAQKMGRKAGQAMPAGTGGLWVDSGTCAVHLEEMSGVRARHPAVWLWEAWQQAAHGPATLRERE
ncbi:MAG: heterodisulfide reductase-related iron-sulfur binding cluster [Thermaerobacter sp.]|nr:heterodisulfide reductase-related iron-sulfur binding cluster [Thermaerobacter sp.]